MKTSKLVSLPKSALARLECSRCQTVADADCVQQLCKCGSPLLARYDLAAARQTLSRESVAKREDDLWRFRELLPVRSDEAIVSLGERSTPVLHLMRIGEHLGLRNLFLKDEGLLPTGSFKARGAAVGISRARELGVRAFAMPTNGNAGVAWSLYAARAGISATIVMPVAAPPIYRIQCAAAGADVHLVNGLIGDAGRIVSRATQRNDVYDASTLKEPYRIEGKKTLAFEIAEQFEWDLPDVIIYPTGGGVGLIGMYKAFEELQALGLISPKSPRFIAVQSSGCAPIVKAWQKDQDTSEAWQDAKTIAFGINVPKALGDFLVLRAVRKTGGIAAAVDDTAITESQRALISVEGVLACAEGGATLAAARLLRSQGKIAADERVLLINTGTGALSTNAPKREFRTLQPDEDL